MGQLIVQDHRSHYDAHCQTNDQQHQTLYAVRLLINTLRARIVSRITLLNVLIKSSHQMGGGAYFISKVGQRQITPAWANNQTIGTRIALNLLLN